MISNRQRKLVVVVSVTDWNEPPRIRHQVTRQLRKHYDVLYVQLYSSSREKLHVVECVDGMHMLRLGFKFPGVGRLLYLIPYADHLYGYYIRSKIEFAIRELKYSSATLVNFQYNIPQICDSQLFDRKIYICNDDFVNMHASHSLARRRYNFLCQKRLSEKCDHVFAVSRFLCDQINDGLVEGKCKLLVPSVEFIDVQISALGSKRQLGGRIKVAFMGYIDDRLNLDWLQYLLSDGRFELTLIGPVSGKFIDPLMGKDGFMHVSPLYGQELLDKLSSFDVLTIPYDVNCPAVIATSVPNKFYQYMNSGRPVVISDMPGFVGCEDDIFYRAIDATSFIQQIITAKNRDSFDLANRRVELSRQNSWEIRINEVRDAIER